MKSLVLDFFLLKLEISLNFNTDAGYKCNRFFEILPKESIKFILNMKNSIDAFNSSFVLMPTKVNLILKK